MRKPQAILAAILLLAPLAAAAEIYKCSEGGTTSFSDKPCPGAGATVSVKPAAGGYNAKEAGRRSADFARYKEVHEEMEQLRRENEAYLRGRQAASAAAPAPEDPCERMKREHAEAKRLAESYVYVPNVRREQERAKKLASQSFFECSGSKRISVFDE